MPKPKPSAKQSRKSERVEVKFGPATFSDYVCQQCLDQILNYNPTIVPAPTIESEAGFDRATNSVDIIARSEVVANHGFSVTTGQGLLQLLLPLIRRAKSRAKWMPDGTRVPEALRFLCLQDNCWLIFKQLMRTKEGLINEDWDNPTRVNLILDYANSRTNLETVKLRLDMDTGSPDALWLLKLCAAIKQRTPFPNTVGTPMNFPGCATFLGELVAECLLDGHAGDLILDLKNAEQIGRQVRPEFGEKLGVLRVPHADLGNRPPLTGKGGLRQSIWWNFRELIESGNPVDMKHSSTTKNSDFRDKRGTKSGVIPSYDALRSAVEESRERVTKQKFELALCGLGLGFLKS